MLDNVDPSQQSENTNPGGAAPADRRCRHTKTDGQPCRNWVLHGRDLCHKHNLFLHARVERPIDVPLLEDEDSVVLLLSEAMRALAWGTIPVSNGRALLDGCRLAHSIHSKKLEMARLRLKVRLLGIPLHEIFGGDAPTLASETPVSSQHRGEPNAEHSPDPANPQPESCEEPITTPIIEPPDQRYHRFRDLKKNWDKELLRGENEMTDMHHKRYGETKEDFLASRATPFEHLEAQDRELQKARDLSAALIAKSESTAINN